MQPSLARDQSVWIVVGLIGFLGLIFVLRDHRRLESYKYSLATAAVGLLLFTMVAGTTVNGARLWIRVGGIQVQPGEFVKLLLVISLAGYLRENREVLTFAHRRVLGVGIPAARHLGPLALMAAVSLGVLAVMNDLGSALLLFGIFLAMIYVATGRHLYTVLGLGSFAAGSLFIYRTVPHVHERFTIWIDPVVARPHHRVPGGAVGRVDRRRRHLRHRPGPQSAGDRARPTIIPAVQTDGIYAAWSDETGLAGAAGLLLIYLLFAYRGFKIATLAEDSFSKLLACGLTFSFTLQAFLIVGGITRLIPLTGITLPFVSYGGSSIVSNFLLLALLLMVSDRAATRRTREPPDHQPLPAGRDRVRAADHDHRLLADLGGHSLAIAARQRPAGVPPAADQARPDPGRPTAARCWRENHAVRRDGLTHVHAPLPVRPAVLPCLGYNTVGDGRTGLELAENPYLTASNSNLSTVISNLGSTLQGETVTGDNVITSLSVPAQTTPRSRDWPGQSAARWWRSSRAPAGWSRCPPRRASTRTGSTPNFAKLNRQSAARRS